MSEEEKKANEHSHEEKKSHGFVAKRSWWQKIRDFNFHSFFATASYGRTITIVGILLIALTTITISIVLPSFNTNNQQHASGLTCTQIKGAICLTSQLCKSNYQYCVSGYGCASGTVCGYDSGACHYNGGSCSVNSNCCSGYCSQGVCGNKPAPIPTPKPTCTGTCTGVACTAANGLAPASGTCPVNRYCCKNQSTPTPIKKITCSTFTGWTSGNGYKGTGICAGTGSTTNHPVCLSGNFYSGYSDCPTATVCCEVASAPTPTPSPIEKQVVCFSDHERTKDRGICWFWKDGASGQVTSNPDQVCKNIGCADNIESLYGQATCAKLMGSGSVSVDNTLADNCGPVSGPFAANLCCTIPTYTTPPPATCTSSVGACEKYQCAAGEKIAISSTKNTFSCAQGPEFVCCAKAPSNSPPKYTCIIPQGSNDPTGNSFSGDDGSVTNCNTGTLCRNGATYSTIKGWSDAKSHICTLTSIPTCTGANGKCQASQSVCGSGFKNDSTLDKSCGNVGICCVPNVAPKPSGGGGSAPTPVTCTNGKATSFALSLKLEGIGTGSLENNSPAHTTRQGIYVKITDQNNAVLYNNTSTTFTYNNGIFSSPSVSLGTALSCGHTYTVTVKIPRYLPAKATVTYGNIQTISLSPIAGDVNSVNLASKIIVGDDKIDILDYNIIRACRDVDPTTPQTFTDNTNTITVSCGDLMNFIDYTDGGTQGDEWSFNYNLWLRGYIKYQGH